MVTVDGVSSGSVGDVGRILEGCSGAVMALGNPRRVLGLCYRAERFEHVSEITRTVYEQCNVDERNSRGARVVNRAERSEHLSKIIRGVFERSEVA